MGRLRHDREAEEVAISVRSEPARPSRDARALRPMTATRSSSQTRRASSSSDRRGYAGREGCGLGERPMRFEAFRRYLVGGTHCASARTREWSNEAEEEETRGRRAMDVRRTRREARERSPLRWRQDRKVRRRAPARLEERAHAPRRRAARRRARGARVMRRERARARRVFGKLLTAAKTVVHRSSPRGARRFSRLRARVR